MAKRKGFQINFSFIMGILATTAVTAYTSLHASDNPLIYLNLVGLIIVVGGIFTVTFMMMPLEDLKQLSKTLSWLFRTNKFERVKTVSELYHFASLQQQELLNYNKASEEATNHFLKEAMELLSLGLKQDDINKVFELKMESKENLTSAQAGFLLTLAKLGPGLGLVGTLVGMVALLYQMGQGLGIEQIGPSMGIALCATLYGVATSNLIFIPLAEAIIHKGAKEELHMKLILNGATMLRERRHPVHIREALKAYLSPVENKELMKFMANETANRMGTNVKEKGVA